MRIHTEAPKPHNKLRTHQPVEPAVNMRAASRVRIRAPCRNARSRLFWRNFTASAAAGNGPFRPRDYIPTSIPPLRTTGAADTVPRDALNTPHITHGNAMRMLDEFQGVTPDAILQDPVIFNAVAARIIQVSPEVLSQQQRDSFPEELHRRNDSDKLHLFFQLLAVTYKRNDAVKLLTMKLMMDLAFVRPNSLQENSGIIRQFIDLLFRYNPQLERHLRESTAALMSDLQSETDPTTSSALYLTQYNFFKFVVVASLISQAPLLASSLYIQAVNSCHNQNFVHYLTLNNELLASIVGSLLVIDPSRDQTHVLAVVKLHEFQNSTLDTISGTWTVAIDPAQFRFQLSDTQKEQLLANLLSLDDRKHLPLKIHVFEKLLDLKQPDSFETKDHLAVYLRYAYQLIETNIHYNNDSVVYFIWSKIKRYHTVLYNAQINSPNNNPQNRFYYYSVMSKMIKFFSKNRRYSSLVEQLIQNIPIKSCTVNPELMDALLIHAAREENIPLSDILIKQLGHDEDGVSGHNYKYITQLTRGQLSALLGLHLKFHDSEGIEKIVSLIYQRYPEGLDHVEMNLICKQMLSSKDSPAEQSEKVWKMFESLDTSLGKSVAILLIDRMVESRNMDFDKIDKIYTDFVTHLSRQDEVWEWVSSLYIKYLVKNFNVRHAQKVYKNSTVRDSPVYFERGANPFLKPYDKAQIYIPHRIRKLVIKTILDASIFNRRNRDREVTFWCFSQLEQLGYGFKELLIDLSVTKKDAHLHKNVNFDLTTKAKLKDTEPLLPGLSDYEHSLSAVFENEYQLLYLEYLKYKGSAGN